MATETKRKKGVMRTLSGKEIDLQNFRPEDVWLPDIARSLSFAIRFNGHIEWGYTVAEHCIIASRIASGEHKLEALLHDAGETYVGDIILPFKEVVDGLDDFENHITATIFNTLYPRNELTFGDTYTKSIYMQVLDRNMAVWESRLLRPTLTPDLAKSEMYDKFLTEYGILQKQWGNMGEYRALPAKALAQAYINEYKRIIEIYGY